MPTALPRVNLTLTPEAYAVVSRISSVTKQGRATIVGDLVQNILPQLSDLAEMLEAAATAREELYGEFAKALDGANEKLLPLAAVTNSLGRDLADRIRQIVAEPTRKGPAPEG